MYKEECLEKMWSILEMLMPEGSVVFDEHSLYRIASKQQLQYYKNWFSAIDGRHLVARLAQADLIVPVPNLQAGGKTCLELSERGRRAFEEYDGQCWQTRASIVDADILAHH